MKLKLTYMPVLLHRFLQAAITPLVNKEKKNYEYFPSSPKSIEV